MRLRIFSLLAALSCAMTASGASTKSASDASATRKDLALRHAEMTLALLDSHTTPASSWSDSEPRRSELRRSALRVLNKLNAAR
jgi:hypothetical protein